MAQILVRQISDAAIERLKVLAREKGTSVEALAREAIHKAAQLGAEEKLALIRRSQEWSCKARVPGAPLSLGVDLIREDRHRDH